jgi:ABC-type lipoprotein release transport system permease subunit
MVLLRAWLLLLALVSSLAVGAGPVVAQEPTPEVPQVLLSRQLVEARGLKVGEIVHLAPEPAGEGARPFRIAGVYEPLPDPFRLTAARLEARFHLPDLIGLTRASDDPLDAESVTRVNVALDDPDDAEGFARDLTSKVPGLTVQTTSRPLSGSNTFVILDRFHTAIATVTILGSAAFLLALMVMRSEERRETAGILRLIGFSRPRILLEIFVEALLVALAGALIGVLIAAVIQGMFNRFFQWRYDTALVFVRVTPEIALRCVVISVPLGVLAGLVSSWTLLRRNIMSLLRR